MKLTMKRKSIPSICAAVILIAALTVSAAAAGGSIADEMAANSAAWWIAKENGDQETMDALHAANEELASQLAGDSGESNYNSEKGTWDITTDDGDHVSSSGSGSYKDKEISYTTTDDDGNEDYSSSYVFSDDSIDSYIDNGGTDDGLVNSYNSLGYKESQYGIAVKDPDNLSAEFEINIAQQVLGLTDEEAADLQSKLEKSKEDYETAHDAYNEAKAHGDEAGMAAAQAAMDAAHDRAEAARGEYNYSADSRASDDGGYFYDEYGNLVPTSGGGVFIVDDDEDIYIYASAGTGGDISPYGKVYVGYYGSKSFTITPHDGYSIASVVVDGYNVGAVSSYSFRSVTSSHSISATFSRNNRNMTITASAGTGGSISPAGTSTVSYGGSQTYTITPRTGYEIQSVTVDGTNVGKVSSYTFSNVTGGHSISATFVKKTFAITASAGRGGSISPSGTTMVTYGESQSFSITPAWGYKIKSLVVDGVNQGEVAGYTFSYVTAPHSISVTFEPSGRVDLEDVDVTDDTGIAADGSGIKSGYGIFASVAASYSGVTDVKVTMTCNFGFGTQTVQLEETGSGVFEYPVNAASPLGKRCVYIPVKTQDGSYPLTFTITARNVEGELLTETSTATVVVRGNMYQDDFTGDS